MMLYGASVYLSTLTLDILLILGSLTIIIIAFIWTLTYDTLILSMYAYEMSLNLHSTSALAAFQLFCG
jgi:hypothetical protein